MLDSVFFNSGRQENGIALQLCRFQISLQLFSLYLALKVLHLV